ncbi:hypothetical protein LT679_06170 [Mucilaginibacter roseus]|uniref:HNH endonuclease n=1 Tax=Mucilaginibacter roseus TaxID=1528868 RepID=A0ABS8U3U3_9SPHI|nr:hypothetical protein [Mucilaginibacter roseus]MCD8740183.1 hypothetical protein [Mucilaginibacter roseus]
MNKYRYPKLPVIKRIPYKSVNAVNEQTPVQAVTDFEAPAHGTYGGLLFDERWKSKRAQILLRDQNKCIICKRSEELQVHHRQYHFNKNQNQFSPPWQYPNNLLITLCKSCHQRGHAKFKVPTLSI